MDLVVKFLADGVLIVILAVSGGALLFGTTTREKKAGYPYLIMAGLTSLLVGKLMSLLYQPEFARPFLEKGVQAGAAYIDNPGFPSDHALLGTVAVLAVVVFVRHRMLSIVLVTCLALMCIARVLALVHTPLDVIGGILAGLIGGVWYLRTHPASPKTQI